MVDSPSTVERDLASVAEILGRGEGVSWAYSLLGDMAARHGLSDAWLVLRPEDAAGAGTATLAGPQVFALSRAAPGGARTSLDTVRALLQRPAGLYGAPRDIDAATNRAVGAMCNSAFRAAVAARGAAIDPVSGLSSRAVIEAAIARAAASGARYGWSSTLVLLTTGGDAPADDRWLALSGALRQALRTGDEVGVTTPGVALAILGNAGPDAVRPFVARVRAALSAGGWDDIDLHAATATTPEETVDPAELERLAAERLTDAGVAMPSAHDPASALELELRLLPGVACVLMSTPVVVIASAPSEPLHDQALRAVRACLPDASVSLLTLGEEAPSAPRSLRSTAFPVESWRHHPNGNGVAGAAGNGAVGRHPKGPSEHPSEVTAGRAVDDRAHVDEPTPRAISATAPRGVGATSHDEGARVSLLGASFDPDRGTSEVSLALGAARGTGRAPAGPLAGGAQATLNALSALHIDVPFYLVSAERAHGVPGEPVVVVLAPKRHGAEDAGGPVERLGVATGASDVEAAGRATLGALNRHLARSPAGS